MYKTIVESVITYGIIDWSGAYKNILKILQFNQNSIIKISLNKDFLTHTLIYTKMCSHSQKTCLQNRSKLPYKKKIIFSLFLQCQYTIRENLFYKRQ